MLCKAPEEIVFQHPGLGPVELVHAIPADLTWYTGRAGDWARRFSRIYGSPVYVADGLVRNIDWSPHHDGTRWTLFGHRPFHVPRLLGRTIGLDLSQGCGGSLACLRLDEMLPDAPLARVLTSGVGPEWSRTPPAP